MSLCRISKKNWYRNFFTEHSNNAKKTWQRITSIINIRSTQKISPTSIIIDNEISTDPKKIANSFNKYFSSIAGKLQAKIYSTIQDFSTYLGDRNEYSFLFTPTDKEDIIYIIDDISINKATGPHSFLLQIIKHVIQTICQKL